MDVYSVFARQHRPTKWKSFCTFEFAVIAVHALVKLALPIFQVLRMRYIATIRGLPQALAVYFRL
ncbi:hypothetical protein PENSPDRAFT_656083 [Peniophora sp. CONT]|nr:hypothetical protein PENSPDRAFT_656083 [Peniophora sp. CONT]